MELTNRLIIEAAQAAQALGKFPLPVKTSLAVAKVAVKLNDLLRPIEATRLEKLMENVKRDADGNPIKKNASEHELKDEIAWQKLFNDLLEDKTLIDGTIPKFKLPEKVPATCDKCKHNMDKHLELPAALLIPLLDFIEE